MDAVEQLLKEVTEAAGISGAEYEVRDVLAKYLEPYGKLSTDKMGSLVCEREGNGPRVLMMAHMDEIGFMVRHITKDGFIKFIPLGGWWDQVLLGHRVIIQTRQGDVVGVIGARPPHLLTAEARNKIVEKKDMYIDIGVSSEDEVTALGVRVGDYIVPDSQFEVLANGKTYVSKAFDDRIGCAVMVKVLEALQGVATPNQIVAVASTQEEVGTRGAETAVKIANPAVAIILESGIAGDVPGIGPEESSQKLGGGPTIAFMDAGMIVHNKLRDLVYDVAEAEGLPLQIGFMPGGGTDGRAVQKYGEGVPTVVLEVPSRHIHSHNSIIHRDDFDKMVQLLVALIKRLDDATVAELQAFGY